MADETDTLPELSPAEQRLQECADRVKANEAEAEALLAERNALWRELSEEGVPADALGRPFGLQAQTVRWNLTKRDGAAAPKAGQARHRGRRKAS